MTFVTIHRDYIKHLKLCLKLQAYGKGAFSKLGYSLPKYPPEDTYTPLTTVKTHYIRRVADSTELVLFYDGKRVEWSHAFHHASYNGYTFHQNLRRLLEHLQPIIDERRYGSLIQNIALDFMGRKEGRVSVAITQAVQFTSSELTRIPNQVISASGGFGKNRRLTAKYSPVRYRKPSLTSGEGFDIYYGFVAVS
jgi:hypothetical protein